MRWQHALCKNAIEFHFLACRLFGNVFKKSSFSSSFCFVFVRKAGINGVTKVNYAYYDYINRELKT